MDRRSDSEWFGLRRLRSVALGRFFVCHERQSRKTFDKDSRIGKNGFRVAERFKCFLILRLEAWNQPVALTRAQRLLR